MEDYNFLITILIVSICFIGATFWSPLSSSVVHLL